MTLVEGSNDGEQNRWGAVTAIYRDRLEEVLALPDLGRALRGRPFDRLSCGLRGSVVIWGCGALGDVIVGAMRDLNVSVAAFVDRAPSRWGTVHHDAPVIAPEDIRTGAYPDSVILIGIFTSEPVRRLLLEWGRPFLTFPELAWGCPAQLLPYCDLDDPVAATERSPGILDGLDVWSDDASRNEYVRQIEWRSTLDYDVLPPHLSARETYFPEQWIALRDDEHFVDCGAYDGDSLCDFVERTNGAFQRYTALEADIASFGRLNDYIASQPPALQRKIAALQMIVGADCGEAYFNANGSVTSNVGDGGVPVKVTTLDAISAQHPISFIKMDIEGFEPVAIAGGRQAIARDRPLLAICVYHAFEHLWTIPTMLRSIVPDYTFHLGRHSDECWELVCYGVPPSRALAAAS